MRSEIIYSRSPGYRRQYLLMYSIKQSKYCTVAEQIISVKNPPNTLIGHGAKSYDSKKAWCLINHSILSGWGGCWGRSVTVYVWDCMQYREYMGKLAIPPISHTCVQMMLLRSVFNVTQRSIT